MPESSYYIASKIFWTVFQPINFLIILCIISTLLLFTKQFKLGRGILVFTSILLATISFTPIGLHSLNAIEWPENSSQLPARVDGILVLGGGVDWVVSKGRGIIELGSAADRIVQAIVLANKFPNAKLVYSGHQGRELKPTIGKQVNIRSLFEDLGLASERIQIELHARNTAENVSYSYKLINPKENEVWIVVTSSFHMSRSMSFFEKQKWDVIPWPVDFRSPGKTGHKPYFYDTLSSMSNVNIATKELIGRLVSKLK